MALTAEARQIIRQEIHKRQKRAYLRELEGKLCVGCGCAHDTYSIGCHNCQDRRRRKLRRQDDTRTNCSHCGRRTRSVHGICTPCQRATAFVASRHAA